MRKRSVRILGKYNNSILKLRNEGKYSIPLNPFIEELKDYRNLQIENIAVFIDTGVMLDHPWIKESLIESHDLTGEGYNDENGHGTAVALIYLSGFYNRPKIISIKALGKDGRGTKKNLIRAIDFACVLKEKYPHIGCINLSVGLDKKMLGLFKCNGFCKVCKAAIRAANLGVFIIAASGNDSSKVCCPAAAQHPGIISVAAASYNKFRMESGDGIIQGLGEYYFVPIDYKLSSDEIEAIYTRTEDN